ncbi:MAG: AraC family transcriptional regulator [Prevotellaceae bacterium]|jgi:AraC-like DNA-binding protein|nr:AraC family transcriptional regulator [Prevotellaceae bacterium]
MITNLKKKLIAFNKEGIKIVLKNAELLFLSKLAVYGLAYIVMFIMIDFYPVVPFFCIFTAFNIAWAICLRKVSDYKVRNVYLVKFYLIEMGVVLYPCALYTFKMGIYIYSVWYMLFPLIILTYHLRSDALKWMLLSILTIGSLFFTQHIFIFESTDNVTQDSKNAISLLTLICMVISSAFFVSVLIKKIAMLNTKEYLQITEQEVKTKEEPPGQKPEKEEIEKNSEQYKKIWEQIIAHFELNEPFTNTGYKISMLAEELNTNVTYISRAITANSDYSFSSLISHYRIEKAKRMLANGDLKLFSMEYIYTGAGFKYQSTFNDSFKKHEGITPKEYVEYRQRAIT